MASGPGYRLYGLWKQRYKQMTGKDYRGNIHRDSLMLKRIVDDVGEATAEELLDFYFKVTKVGFDFNWFLYNYDRLERELRDIREDKERRRKLRQRTAEVMEQQRRESELRSETD